MYRTGNDVRGLSVTDLTDPIYIVHPPFLIQNRNGLAKSLRGSAAEIATGPVFGEARTVAVHSTARCEL